MTKNVHIYDKDQDNDHIKENIKELSKFLNNRINNFRLRQAFAHCCELPQV